MGKAYGKNGRDGMCIQGLIGKPEEKRSLGRCWSRQEHNY
jgi:hypothetical protein